VDPTDSNIIYFELYGRAQKSTDGGNTIVPKGSGLPLQGNGLPHIIALAIDPTDHNTLVAYSDVVNRGVYRTRTAMEPQPPANAWLPISQQLNVSINAFAFAPSGTAPSNVIFGATFGHVWGTTDAVGWSQIDVQGLPARPLTSIAIDYSTQCQGGAQLCGPSCPCNMYVTAGLFNDQGPAGHVFRSTDSGQHWNDIGAGVLPDVPANKIVVHPGCPNVVYVATDMGIFQGTLYDGRCNTFNNGTWNWCPYTNGFPQTALAEDLRIDPQSGVMRAFTFGRSAWEIKLPAYAIPNPDQKVDSSGAVTSVSAPAISSDGGGQNYAVAWTDNRQGANWRVQFRGYNYPNGNPTPIAAEVQADDTTDHTAAQSPSVAVSPVPLSGCPAACANVAWVDDRLDRVNHTNHAFFQFVCPNGDKRWLGGDVRADTASAAASNPVIAAQAQGTTNGSFALAWQSAGSIYERFFGILGIPRSGQCPPPSGNQECKVNFNATASAARPAIAVDGGDNVFVAWEESDGLTPKIWISKYGPTGACVKGSGSNCSGVPPSVQLDQGSSGVARSQVALAVDNANNVVATWWEGVLGGPEMIVAKRCTNSLTGCVFIDAKCNTKCRGGSSGNQPCQADADCAGGGQCTSRKCLNGAQAGSACLFDSDCGGGVCGAPAAYCAPLAPPGVTRAKASSAAVDASVPGSLLLAWQGNVNDPSPNPVWTGFARGFDSNLATVRSDFRVDLAGRSTVVAPRLARSQFTNRYAAAWKDNRAGHDDVYTRLVPAP
jgi:hypothetical protein